MEIDLSDQNPYSAPTSRVADPTGADDPELDNIATGQRLVIISLIISFVASAMRTSIGDVALLGSLGASGLAVYGIVRLAAGLGINVAMRVFLAVLMFVPLVNLITMLVLSMRATARLRDAGYKVGLMGASKRS